LVLDEGDRGPALGVHAEAAEAGETVHTQETEKETTMCMLDRTWVKLCTYWLV